MKHIKFISTWLLLFCLSGALCGQKNPDLQKANKEYELRAFHLALNSYQKVLNTEPNNVIALSGVADCYRHLGNMRAAADWYASAIQQPGVDPVNLFHYGKTLMALGQYEKAIEWFLLYAEGQPVYGQHYAESCQFAISLRGMPASYRVKKEFANTDASEFGPAFLGDNLVFSSARSDRPRNYDKKSSSWDGRAKNQLYISSTDVNGFLANPRFLLNDLQHEYNQGLLSYSANGKWVAFTKNNFVNGIRQIPSSGIELSIFIAEAAPDGSWKNAVAFPFNGSGYSSGYPHLSADGNTLYFASNRPDGFGGYDLYVSTRNGKSWSVPENLGPVINSAGNEISPFVEGNALYFASDWHHGLGGFDLFRAITENDVWSKVFHLGNAVNSPYDDYSLVFNKHKNKGYFVSNRKGGVGNEDIYQISKIAEEITVTVLDQANGQPIKGALLDFTACGEKTYQTDDYGKYRFQAFDGLRCEVIVGYAGYGSKVLRINDPTEQQKMEYTVALAKAPNLLSGLVINAQTSQPVAEVVISAQARNSAQVHKTTSLPDGTYQLTLQPNTSYIIRYSKMGFLDTHQQIETRAALDKNILGVLMLNPAGTHLDGESDMVVSSSTTTGDITATTQPDNDLEAVPLEFGSPAAVETEKGPATKLEKPQEGFAIQVAALKTSDKVSSPRFEALKEIGNLYSRDQKGLKKVRVGIYASRSEAEEARKDIVKKGFDKAFIVPERVVSLSEIDLYDDIGSVKRVPVPKESVPPPQMVEKEVPTDEAKFMVRLGAYKKPEYFDAKKVNALGRVAKFKKGEYTIMLLTGFNSLQSARQAGVRARELGFTGAHVVLQENGKLIKI